MNEIEIIQAAIAEVANPTLAIVEQFFSVHELDSNNPIAHIDPPQIITDDKQTSKWDVYMNLKDVDYVWIMYVKEHDSRAIPEFGVSSEYARVYLNIGSQNLTPKDIAERLDLPATRSNRIGENLFNGESPMQYKENRYYYEPDVPVAWDFGKKFKSLISDLSPHLENIREISQESLWCQVTVAYTGWQAQMWGCHFTSEDLDVLSSMGVSVDIDLYAEGPDLPDD